VVTEQVEAAVVVPPPEPPVPEPPEPPEPPELPEEELPPLEPLPELPVLPDPELLAPPGSVLPPPQPDNAKVKPMTPTDANNPTRERTRC
jgi:hypothetical protein